MKTPRSFHSLPPKGALASFGAARQEMLWMPPT